MAVGVRVPAGLLGMLPLVLAVELGIGGAGRFATDAALCWRTAARAATESAAVDSDVLLFGDSMVKIGVLARVVAERSGVPSYNLALYAGPPMASEILLRRALDHGATPQAVVADFMPHQLAAPVVEPTMIRPWAELLAPGDLLALARAGAGTAELTRIALALALPSYRSRQEVRSEARATLAGRRWNLGHWFRVLQRNWAVNRGSQPNEPRPKPGEIDPRNPGLFPTAWRPDPRAVAAVRRFIRAAEGSGAVVYWLIPPIHPEGQALREKLGRDAEYLAVVRALRAEFPGVVVVDARHAGYPAHRFRDAVHLDCRGADALSADLAAVVAAGPAGGGWVTLPPFREPAGVRPVEDLEQSRIALNRRSAARR